MYYVNTLYTYVSITKKEISEVADLYSSQKVLAISFVHGQNCTSSLVVQTYNDVL